MQDLWPEMGMGGCYTEGVYSALLWYYIYINLFLLAWSEVYIQGTVITCTSSMNVYLHAYICIVALQWTVMLDATMAALVLDLTCAAVPPPSRDRIVKIVSLLHGRVL